MSINTIESPDAQPIAQKQNSELIYRLEARRRCRRRFLPPASIFWRCLLPVITPALLICQALGLPGPAGHAAHYQHVSVRLRRGLDYSN